LRVNALLAIAGVRPAGHEQRLRGVNSWVMLSLLSSPLNPGTIVVACAN
jgi:hypothetical protein